MSAAEDLRKKAVQSGQAEAQGQVAEKRKLLQPTTDLGEPDKQRAHEVSQLKAQHAHESEVAKSTKKAKALQAMQDVWSGPSVVSKYM